MDASPEAWKAWLARLVPEDGTTITDETGNTYVLPARLNARRQIRVGRKLQELLAVGVDDAMRAQIAGVTSGKLDADAVLAAAAVALGLLSDDRLALLDATFAEAYPDVLAAARGGAVQKDGAFELGALDLFPGEEVLRAMLPLFVAPARRLAA